MGYGSLGLCAERVELVSVLKICDGRLRLGMCFKRMRQLLGPSRSALSGTPGSRS